MYYIVNVLSPRL